MMFMDGPLRNVNLVATAGDKVVMPWIALEAAVFPKVSHRTVTALILHSSARWGGAKCTI